MFFTGHLNHLFNDFLMANMYTVEGSDRQNGSFSAREVIDMVESLHQLQDVNYVLLNVFMVASKPLKTKVLIASLALVSRSPSCSFSVESQLPRT